MPHIIIEHSQSAIALPERQGLVDELYQVVESAGLFKSENIKVRLHPLEYFKLGLPDSEFIHVMCRIHVGKTDEQKQWLTQAVLNAISERIEGRCVITVEVVEMARGSYAKMIL